ncbi:unnamed protein product [Somion occarium]|uniref:Uncharacterized protein n=1 Tax=Somion occarium TaxID=3059160 RepID=A0ABP1E9W9_9APHY
MTATKKLTLLYFLVLSFSSGFSNPIPADGTPLSLEPPTSMVQSGDTSVTTAPNDANPSADLPPPVADTGITTPDPPAPSDSSEPDPATTATPASAPWSSPVVFEVTSDPPTDDATQQEPQAQETPDLLSSAESDLPEPAAYQTPTPTLEPPVVVDDITPVPAPPNEQVTPDADVVPVVAAPATSSDTRTTYTASFTPQSTVSRTSFTSPASASTTRHLVPIPSDVHSGISPATERSRRAAVVGALLAICIVVSLVGCFFCLRCRSPGFLRRKAASQKYIEDQEKQSINSEKNSPSPKSLSSEDMTLPVLQSNTATSGTAFPQEQWRYLATNNAGQYEDVSHALVGGPYTDISLESNADIHSSAGSIGGESDVAIIGDRTSAGATSTTQSYSTCGSRYSGQSGDHTQDMSLESIECLPTFLCAPPPVAKQGRARSKTVTHSSGSRLGTASSTSALFAASKSYPTKLSSSLGVNSRLSTESTRSEATKRSTGSEWDVAQEYGRFSKESMLTAISEDPEHVEAVEVGAKTCVLVTGKF